MTISELAQSEQAGLHIAPTFPARWAQDTAIPADALIGCWGCAGQCAFCREGGAVAEAFQQYGPRIPEVLPMDSLVAGVAQGNAQFAEKVAQWQRKLGTVDVVLNTWAEVQKKWANLESIFVGSADIRVQLPEDSKRFDAVNTDFQVQVSTCTRA